MTLSKYDGKTDYISSLADKPNQNGGLTAAQLKQKYDQAGADIKAYINNILTAELEADFATKEELSNTTLGQIADNTITGAKMANDMKKDIVGGVAGYDYFYSQLSQMAKLTDFSSNIVTNGYQQLPSGLIIQWAYYTVTSTSNGTIDLNNYNFPISFSSQILHLGGNIYPVNHSSFPLSPLSVAGLSLSQYRAVAIGLTADTQYNVGIFTLGQ